MFTAVPMDGDRVRPTENTLDEPVYETFLRDIRSLGRKTLAVMLPFPLPWLGPVNHLTDWDLWGPLILCLILAMVLGTHAGTDQGGIVFCGVFFIVWLGGGIVTVNAKVLGAKLSFFQIICVLGYCLAPICLSAIIITFASNSWIVKGITSVTAWVWATSASFRFFSGVVRESRKLLVVYPVSLFYFFFCWMMVVGL